MIIRLPVCGLMRMSGISCEVGPARRRQAGEGVILAADEHEWVPDQGLDVEIPAVGGDER